jgi:hypothetical protein
MKEFYIKARKVITVILITITFKIMPDCYFKKKYKQLIVKELMKF